MARPTVGLLANTTRLVSRSPAYDPGLPGPVWGGLRLWTRLFLGHYGSDGPQYGARGRYAFLVAGPSVGDAPSKTGSLSRSRCSPRGTSLSRTARNAIAEQCRKPLDRPSTCWAYSWMPKPRGEVSAPVRQENVVAVRRERGRQATTAVTCSSLPAAIPNIAWRHCR